MFLRADGVGLRREDLKKAREITALLAELRPFIRADRVLVDAAAGHAAVGLLAQRLLAPCRLVVIERAPDRVLACQAAAVDAPGPVEIRALDVADRAAWPDAPDVVVGLHACGPATDHILDHAVEVRASRLWLVPCCIGQGVRFMPRAEALAARLPLPRQAAVRQKLVHGFIDAWRTLRLEAAGYEVTVAALVPPTVTPYHLVWRARRVGEPAAMARARAQLHRLVEGEADPLELGQER